MMVETAAKVKAGLVWTFLISKHASNPSSTTHSKFDYNCNCLLFCDINCFTTTTNPPTYSKFNTNAIAYSFVLSVVLLNTIFVARRLLIWRNWCVRCWALRQHLGQWWFLSHDEYSSIKEILHALFLIRRWFVTLTTQIFIPLYSTL